MKTTDIYSKEELELFDMLEKDVDSGKYKPMLKEKLDDKKAFFKEIAINTLEQGLLCQTLISSVIHKLALKQIKLA